MTDADDTGRLRLEAVAKAYDPGAAVRAVDGVSLDIVPGEFLTLLGPSGCGKTTILRMIAGFETPTEGRITLDGRDLTRLPAHRRPISMVFQSYALFPHMSVRENIGYGLRSHGVRGDDLHRRVAEALETMGLSPHATKAPAQLSGGQQQRVALARAMVMRPRVMLFDEPLSNLDAALRERMRTEIRGLQRRAGTTAVYVTHDQGEAMAISDRVVVLRDGTVEQVGTPAEIYRGPASRFVADFVGQANLLSAEVLEIAGHTARVRVLGHTCWVPAHPAAEVGDAAELLIRPESLRLRHPEQLRLRHPESQPPSEAAAQERAPESVEVSAQVRSGAFVGDRMEYTLEAAGQQLLVVVSDPEELTALPEGTVVTVGLRGSRSWLLPSR